ncbi:guanine nucleotide-exchange factor SEC12-like [Mytilus edulis]|uniref:guanine nucleotide-exchange factor SEC12-like n=1 Tax=Mytilus edulis TaxID=6550 RepID=UPI0039F0B203
MAANGKGGLLARSDFPLYTVNALDERHFIVAGGGGAAKTGVVNAIEVYEVRQTDNKLIASSIGRHDTGTKAVMNGCCHYDGRKHILAAGLDEKCHTYSLKYKVVSPKKNSGKTDDTVRKRKSNDGTEENGTKQINFDIEELDSFETDFNKDGSFQKTVQFSMDQKFLATGGADGFLRVWKYPELSKIFEVHAHKGDIDDVAISPANDKIVTVSRDHCACVWNAKEGSKDCELKWPLSDQYRHRACKYGLIEGSKEHYNLYTISIPVKRSQNPAPCYLAMWDSKKFTVKRMVSTGIEVLSALAISDDGTYAAVGTISGSVAVFISFSLQKLYSVSEAHNIFVTGLDFLPSSKATEAVTGDKDFTLLSISADNTIRVHQVAKRGSYSIVLLLIGLVVIVVLLFIFMAEMGL